MPFYQHIVLMFCLSLMFWFIFVYCIICRTRFICSYCSASNCSFCWKLTCVFLRTSLIAAAMLAAATYPTCIIVVLTGNWLRLYFQFHRWQVHRTATTVVVAFFSDPYCSLCIFYSVLTCGPMINWNMTIICLKFLCWLSLIFSMMPNFL